MTYLLPVVGILLGVLILHETLTWNEPVATLLVTLGIVFTQGRLRLHRRHGRIDPGEVIAPST